MKKKKEYSIQHGRPNHCKNGKNNTSPQNQYFHMFCRCNIEDLQNTIDVDMVSQTYKSVTQKTSRYTDLPQNKTKKINYE